MPVKQDEERRRKDAAKRRAASARRTQVNRRGSAGGRSGRGRGSSRRDARPVDVTWQVTVIAFAVIVALVVGVVVGVRLGLAEKSANADDARRTAVLQAARQQALNFTTISYKTVDRDIARVVAGSTGDFKADYQEKKKTTKTAVTKNKAVSKGQVLGAGIKSVDSDSAVVLVVVDASVTNVAQKKPALRHYRMQFDMAKTPNGKWLMSGVVFVG